MNLTLQTLLKNILKKCHCPGVEMNTWKIPIMIDLHTISRLSPPGISNIFLIVRVKSIILVFQLPDMKVPLPNFIFKCRLSRTAATFRATSKPRISTSLVSMGSGRLANSYNPGTSHSSMLYWKASATFSTGLNFTESYATFSVEFSKTPSNSHIRASLMTETHSSGLLGRLSWGPKVLQDNVESLNMNKYVVDAPFEKDPEEWSEFVCFYTMQIYWFLIAWTLKLSLRSGEQKHVPKNLRLRLKSTSGHPE